VYANGVQDRTFDLITKGARMTKLFPVRSRRLSLIVTSGTLLLSAVCIYLFMHSSKRPPTPAVPVVSACKELTPGMRRIGEGYGLQFDVPAKDFVIHEGASDAPPLVHGFGLRPKGSESLLEISYGLRQGNMAVDPTRVFSTHVEKRNIPNDKGRTIGDDEWGYLSSGERWRQIRLWGGDSVKYGLVSQKEAELFDRVISSACLSPASDH